MPRGGANNTAREASDTRRKRARVKKKKKRKERKEGDAEVW